MKTAEEILRSNVSKDCIWEDMNNLTNTPIRDVVKAMEEYAEQRVEEATRWITVSDILPEAGEIVQLFNRKWKLGKRVLVGDTTLWHYDGDTLYTYDAPTHWQPLPKAPTV